MKTLIVALFLISTHLTFGQDYSDTIYYKTGMVRSGDIFKETKNTIRYNYLGANGRVMTTTARKSMLNKVTVGDESTSVASNFESNNQSLVESGVQPVDNKSAVVAVASVGAGVVAIVVIAGTAIILTVRAILRSIF